ncbi:MULTISPECIES: hypothetical protein [Proteus]|uniref:hypothetical protein n=1 Tax=Proteus TaxID=583 RepID=UPI002024BB17|nr:hypothetical protein [Proteus mirabilis]MCL8618232.1 hypothetical protein [Proteus mirabilis]
MNKTKGCLIANFATVPLNQPRQKVRRRLEKLEIKAINEDTRTYENEPLEYNHQAFLKLAEEFDVRIDNKECTASVQRMNSTVQQKKQAKIN